MAKYDVRVRYAFEGTYTVVAEDHDEARQMVSEDCGLVLGGNIHTTLDDEDVDWNFGVHPDTQILSVAQRNGKGTSASIDFSGRIEELRADIIEAIRQLLQAHCMTEIRFPEDDGYDPVWVIWFSKNGDPYECMVTGLRVTENSLTVLPRRKRAVMKWNVTVRLNSERGTSTGSTKCMMPYGGNWKAKNMLNLKLKNHEIPRRKCSLQLLLLYVERMEQRRM